ncbi:alkane hydroxylase MAH1-like [Aristolochia californica]|uniref:alkane hydroxylase MAH1-like n=1 Tax=Aristolochia californica TaxID=171875 RepID=UPI0035E03297
MGIRWILGLLNYLHAYPEVVVTVICFFILRRMSLNPSALRSWPVVGMLPSMLANTHRIHDWSAEILQKSGGTIFFKGPWFAGMDLLATADPTNVRYITSTARAGDYPKGQDYTEMFDILGNGILNADSDSWRIQRRWAHLLMRQMRFRRYVESTGREKVEKGLLPVLDHMAGEDVPVDLQDVMQRFTFDATCVFVCGVDPGCLSVTFPVVPFAKAVDDAKEVIHLRHTVPRTWWKLFRWLRIRNEKTMAEATEIADGCIVEYISTRRKELEQAKSDTTEKNKEEEEVDLLTSYLDYEAEEEMERMKSDKFLRDVILNMLVAGRDTTSAALTWFFWELSRNPRLEAKILDELRTKLPATEKQEENSSSTTKKKLRVFNADELGGLVYLHAALSECLRLYPPVPIIHKCATANDTFPSGHRIRPGLKIYYCLYAMARMETIWGKDCNEFKPERWISEAGTVRTDHSDKFFTFNAGPRSCLGKGVSFTQMKMAAGAILYNFQVQVLKNQIICPKVSVILHTENGLKVKIRRREL